jgi:phosphatidylglycerophosphatase C
MSEASTPPLGGRVVAVFDFDGTLTKRDTLRLFFIELCGWRGLSRAILAELPSMLAAGMLGNHHRDRARAALTRRLLGGRPEEETLAAAQRLAERVVKGLLRQDTRAWLCWHQSQGHEILIISASFAAYVEPVARRLGTEMVMATRWEVDASACLTGGLAGRNVRGQEKVERLRQHLRDGDASIYAYGNSAGDRFLLALAKKNGRRVRRYWRLPSPPEPPPGA